MINAVSNRTTAITRAFAPPLRASSPDQVTLGSRAKDAAFSLGKNVLGVAGKAALLGGTALAGWLGGPQGLIAATVGGGIGYGVYAATTLGEKDLKTMGEAAAAGTVVGILGGLAGKALGLDGVIVMGALGACGSVIARTVNWSEGWTQDGHYVG